MSQQFEVKIGGNTIESIQPGSELSLDDYHQLLFRYLTEVGFPFPERDYINKLIEGKHRRNLAAALHDKGVKIKI